MQEKVKFARELKATTLVISGQDDIAKNLAPMLKIWEMYMLVTF